MTAKDVPPQVSYDSLLESFLQGLSNSSALHFVQDPTAKNVPNSMYFHDFPPAKLNTPVYNSYILIYTYSYDKISIMWIVSF